MSGFLLLLSASVGAPALKNPSLPELEVVHATCVSTAEKEGNWDLESTFVISDPGGGPDVERGQRFKVRYSRFGATLYRSAGELLLKKFEPGDRSYWLLRRGEDGLGVAVGAMPSLMKHALPEPYHLIHQLTDKETPHAWTTLPNETDTRELARIVSKGLRLKTREERAEFIKQESDTKNKYVKQYLEWLEKQGKQ